jgi:RecA-family ATPase
MVPPSIFSGKLSSYKSFQVVNHHFSTIRVNTKSKVIKGGINMSEAIHNGDNTQQLGPTTVNGWLRKLQPEIIWDIKQLMAQGTTTIISGNTGIGKSWETKHLAFQFRLGGKWHGLPCRQLTPIYICLELTDRQMQRRIRKLAPIYPTVKDINFLAHKGYDYRLNTNLGRDNLLKQLRSFNQNFGVIMLDPLASFIKGKVQEVDWNNEVEPFLTKIKLEFGCSIILNHNFRKRVQIFGHGEDIFAPDRLKGVSDIIDRADNIVVFSANLNQENMQTINLIE